MKRIALAAALAALSTTAAMAAPGDAWYGTNRDDRVIVAPTVTYTQPAPTERVTVYYDEPVQTAPVIVEREYVTAPYGVVVAEPVRDDRFFYVEPRTYSRIGRDLFPKKGPNDFGQ